ncbi:MAG: LysM peptidoglycan-binding domain-containing protein, partial [Alphaproteobacteria bacterium]|nr:LysM peptidoglycan-binding domain-containing protein [Alphaproteobacteria bacterium]
FIVVFIAIWAGFIRANRSSTIILTPEVPAQVVTKQKKEITVPEFDIVRISKDGGIIIAGRWLPNQNVSVMVNNRVVATERTNLDGEFAYSPKNKWKPGNYTIALVGAEPEVKSSEKVFVYISEKGPENSVSLLMTKNGSTLLQMPAVLNDNDLTDSKIDYLDTGRIVVTGDGMPRLRVSLSLDDKYVGFARVSDYKHFGLGADVGDLEVGKEYTLTVRMHDGDGRTVSTVTHKFTMPEMTGEDDTYYTVRRGDCLWIIARNFMRRGVLFSIIADTNNIKNPDLIFPKQVLQIPVSKK